VEGWIIISLVASIALNRGATWNVQRTALVKEIMNLRNVTGRVHDLFCATISTFGSVSEDK
jgi:hypothetical protein